MLFLPVTEVFAQRSSETNRLIDRTADIPNDFKEQGEIIGEQFTDRFEDGFDALGQPGSIGEDILFNIREYQPQPLRSSLLEDQGANVFAILQGKSTNPAITIPDIKSVTIRRQKITTSPAGAPVSIGRVRYLRPASKILTYENLGYLVIPIRPIPKENDVPDEIIVDLEAQVSFDISEGLTFGPMKDVLMEQNPEQWLLTREDHSFYAGYLRVSEIKADQATVHIYDNNGNEVRGSPLTLKVGQTSRSVNARAEFGYSRTGTVFDRFTIKLDNIQSLTDKARFLVTRDGKTQYTVVTEGEALYPGSSWYIENIITDPLGEDVTVKVRNKNAAGTLDKNVEEITAKKLQIDPRQPTTKRSAAGSAPASGSDQNIEEYKTILGEYNELKAEGEKNPSADGYINYQATINSLQAMHTKIGISAQAKTFVESLLKTIQRYYNGKMIERQLTTERREISGIADKIEADYQKVSKIIEKIETDKTKLPSSAKTDPADLSSAAYIQARDEYQKVIDEFSASEDKEVRKKVAAAHWRIATLPLNLVRKETRLYHLETLLNSFDPEEYKGVTDKQSIGKLRKLLETIEYDLQSVSLELTESTNGEVFSVVLVGTEKAPEHLKSVATINLDGTQTNKYEEGQELLWSATAGDGQRIKWIVREINDNAITISQIDGSNAASLVKSAEPSFEIKKGVQGKIKLVDTQVHKEAHITVAPVVERAISEAFFTIHLPIEKRAFDLPLFSDTVEEEIAKTEDLLAKLDEIIKNVRTITEYWQKFCLITFGVLVVKNFFSGVFAGSSELRARDRTTDMFKKRYQDCQSIERGKPGSCAGTTYDQYIFEHQDEYESTIEQTADIIGSKPADYNKNNFEKLGSEYDSSKDDLYYYEEMLKRNPNDETVRTKYFGTHAQLAQADFDNKVTDVLFEGGKLKDYSKLEKEYPGLVKNTLADPRMEDSLKELYTSSSKEERDKMDALKSRPDALPQYLWNTHNTRLVPHFKEKVSKEYMKNYLDGMKSAPYAATNTAATDKVIGDLKQVYRVGDIDTQALGTFQHSPKITFATSGKGADNVQFISIDAVNYVQVSYTTGGRIQQYDLYRRTSPNGPMGHRSDVYLGVVDEQFLATYRAGSDLERQTTAKNLDRVRDCIGRINKQHSQTKYGRGSKVATNAIGCGNLGKYVVEQSSLASDATGPSCTEFMSPTDCKLLFNACDPVICPPSRCNLGGNWYVDNVVETGIIGSALLCAPNFIAFNPEGGVVMPVCLTGIHAGLQNIRSVIEGYRQCLITAKVSGNAVGICDRIRSFGICEILWKEAIAIFDAKEGILTQLDKLFRGSSAASGGDEYSAFSQSFDNSVKSVEYFTKSYAKNTFARYSGGSLNEIGTEICKAAIFRKAPGLGNIFDEITRPESPPQFNAFFDEAPYSDISDIPLSQYKVFYHIYAGETPGPGPVTYSMWLQAKDPYTNNYIHPPTFVQDRRGVVRGRRMAAGAFASDSPDVVMPAGMQEICIEIVTQTYGRKVECGFGKVSTGFALNYVTDQFTQHEANKRINSASECISKASTITNAVQDYGVAGVGVGAVGTVSSGFTSTGIVRKCAKESPGIGGNEEKWNPVGSCGNDELGRDLGTCWLYVPAAKNLIKDVGGRTQFVGTLNKTAQEVIKQAEAAGRPIPGFYTLSSAEVKKQLEEAKGFIENAKTKGEAVAKIPDPADQVRQKLVAEVLQHLMDARERYNHVIDAFDVGEQDHAAAQFLLAESYEKEAKIFFVKVNPSSAPGASSTTPAQTTPPTVSPPAAGTTSSSTATVTSPASSPAAPTTSTTTGNKCKINGYWANKDKQKINGAEEDLEVFINLDFKDCEGLQLTLEVFEYDWSSPYDIVLKTDIIQENKQIKWKVEYQEDDAEAIFFKTNPTYYFKVYLKDIPDKIFLLKSESLVVTKNTAPKVSSNAGSSKKPTIDEVIPSEVKEGNDVIITLKGKDFDKNVEVFFTPATIKEPDVSYSLNQNRISRGSNTELTVRISKSRLSPGSHNIIVQNKGSNIASEPANINVRTN